MSRKDALNVVGGHALTLAKMLPWTKAKVAAEEKKIEDQIEEGLKKPATRGFITALPEAGRPAADIVDEMTRLTQGENTKWEDGKVSGAVYHGGDEHMGLMNKTYELFSVSNPLHSDLWPSVMRFESEVIAMTASMVNGGDTSVCGVITTGGTESIFMSVRAHRQWGREQLGITHAEVVAPVSAHAAFDKACDVLNMRLIKIPVDPKTGAVRARDVSRAITSDTVLIVGSAPGFPHGIIDPIEALAKIAKRRGVGMHVDCCLGGFFLPFMRDLGEDVPRFDFGLDGVTAMSCDTHKYGYAAKGTSVVLYRGRDLRRHGYFKYADWPGGLYATASLPGSRSGALSAACWASMMKMGREGYMEATRGILNSARAMRRGIDAMPELRVIGDPIAMVVAFDSPGLNIYHIGDRMSHRGWVLSTLQRPPALHIACTLRHVGVEDAFLADLAACVAEVVAAPHEEDKGGSAPIYGMTGSMPAGAVETLLNTYVDVTLKV